MSDGPAGANEPPSFRHQVPKATKKSLQPGLVHGSAGIRAVEWKGKELFSKGVWNRDFRVPDTFGKQLCWVENLLRFYTAKRLHPKAQGRAAHPGTKPASHEGLPRSGYTPQPGVAQRTPGPSRPPGGVTAKRLYKGRPLCNPFGAGLPISG